MRLEDCTKAELISIIHRICGRLTPAKEDYYIHWCLNDIEYQRKLTKINQAEEWGKKADEARKQYCEFLKKYEGYKLVDIPLDEVLKAEELLKTAQKADKKFRELARLE